MIEVLNNHPKEIFLSTEQWLEKIKTDLPLLWNLALESKTIQEFIQAILSFLEDSKTNVNAYNHAAMNCLKEIIQLENKVRLERSEEEFLKMNTLSNLWKGVHGENSNLQPDFYAEIYHLFNNVMVGITPSNEFLTMSQSMSCWPNALDPEVHEIMQANKERIIQLLIQDISNHLHNSNSRYVFKDDLEESEKKTLVNEWWNDHRFHLSMAIRHPDRLNRYLNNSLSEEVMTRLHEAYDKGIPFFVTPYYLSLLNIHKEGYDDHTVREYIIYSQDLIDNFGTIKAWEREDKVISGQANAAGWLLPDGHNVHRRYPEVAILIPDTMGRACGGLCASCQRMYGFQKGHLNFDLEALKPQKGWLSNLSDCLQYFEHDSQIRDILITGGDALMSQNKTLEVLLEEVLKMATRKKETNKYRSKEDQYAEIKRVRLGSRLPAYLPFRINEELIEILKVFKEKGEKVGIEQFIIQTHFQSPLELTEPSVKAIQLLQHAGWVVTNQLVFTVPASRRGHTAQLRHDLNQLGVLCYYTFTVKGFDENKNLFVPNCRSVQESLEEKKAGVLTQQEKETLIASLAIPEESATHMKTLLETFNHPFFATDRNVMNLPGIGKSMSFRLIGIDEQGRRLLSFSHDSTRRHSPIIESTPELIIRERKSVASYLRQLNEMGENVEEYDSIWSYYQASTEPRFDFYDYPKQTNEITSHMTNLKLS